MAFSQHNSGISFGRQIVKGRFSQAVFKVLLCIGLGRQIFLFVLASSCFSFHHHSLGLASMDLTLSSINSLMPKHAHLDLERTIYSCVA